MRFAEDAVRELMLRDSSYSAIVGKVRVYPLVAPQGVPLPYAITETSPETPSGHLVSESGVAESMVDVFHYSNDYDQARMMGEHARNALSKHQGQVNVDGQSIYIPSLRLTETNMEHLPDQAGGEIGIFENRQTYRVWHNTQNPS